MSTSTEDKEQLAAERAAEEERVRRSATTATEEELAILTELYEVAAQQREVKKRYENLRNAAVLLLGTGPRHFIAPDGSKRYAVRRQQEPIVVDVDMLVAEIDDQALLDRIAPRRVINEAFHQAWQSEEISDELYVRASRIKANAPFVGFGSYD